MKKMIVLLSFGLMFLLVHCSSNSANAKKYIVVEGQKMTWAAEDGNEAKGKFYPGQGQSAVIISNGMMFELEKYQELAKIFQEAGIGVVVMEFCRAFGAEDDYHMDVKAAYGFLKKRGYAKISLIGEGHRGGTGAMEFAKKNPALAVNKLILLSPKTGDGVKRSDFSKLILVGKEDEDKSMAQDLFTKTAEPKRMKEIPGNEPTVFMLLKENKNLLIDEILKFLS